MKRAGSLHGDREAAVRAAPFAITFGWYPPALRIGRHEHENASVCFVLAGGYEECYGRRTRDARGGMLIVHPAGEAHSDRHGTQATRLLAIEFAPEAVHEAGPALRCLGEAWDRDATALVPLAFRLRCAIEAPAPLPAAAVADAVWTLFAAAAGHLQPSASRSPWLHAVRDRLDHEPDTDLATLALQAGVHPMHLTRAFRQAYGCSIGDYARRRRVGRAMLMLAGTRTGLADIAADAGFADQSHLTRQVHAMTARAPGAWRTRLARR